MDDDLGGADVLFYLMPPSRRTRAQRYHPLAALKVEEEAARRLCARCQGRRQPKRRAAWRFEDDDIETGVRQELRAMGCCDRSPEIKYPKL
jgi:hypothetical protein